VLGNLDDLQKKMLWFRPIEEMNAIAQNILGKYMPRTAGYSMPAAPAPAAPAASGLPAGWEPHPTAPGYAWQPATNQVVPVSSLGAPPAPPAPPPAPAYAPPPAPAYSAPLPPPAAPGLSLGAPPPAPPVFSPAAPGMPAGVMTPGALEQSLAAHPGAPPPPPAGGPPPPPPGWNPATGSPFGS
jgi:hypothetical protein